MTWLSENGCGKCDHCGMDMDMAPYCVNGSVLEAVTLETGRSYPYGLNINTARLQCKGDNFIVRQPAQ